ncbi:MAG: hypothetical protein U0P45_13160 [Acidimicrobiales bacterium]
MGILATIATGGAALAVVAGGVLGGAIGYGGRVAAAIPRNSTPQVDPFGVDEPWRHAVQDALQARSRYQEAVGSFRKGPLKETLVGIGDQLDDAVLQCWQVAKQGQHLTDGRKRIDDREVNWQLQQAAAQIPPGGAASPVQAQLVASLNAQLAAAARLDEQIRSTYDQLQLLNARLDETVTQAIELSATATAGSFDPVGQSMGDIVDDLTSLREAMTSLDAPEAPAAPPTAMPQPAAAPEPPTGQAQASSGA